MESELKVQIANLTKQFEDAARKMESPEFKDPAAEAYISATYATIELLNNSPSGTSITQANTTMLFLSGFLEQKKLATHDQLTEVKNRRSFMHDLRSAINSHQKAKAHNRHHEVKRAIAFIDLDFFKKINDSLGHVGGNKALKKIAKTLEDTVRTEEDIYRIGGDEFALILEDHEHNKSNKNIKMAIKRFETAISELTIEHNGEEMPLQASIGYHVIKGNETEEALEDLADKALYKSKETKDARQEKVWNIIRNKQNLTEELTQ